MNFVSLGDQTDSTQLNVQLQAAAAYAILNNGQGLQWTDFSILNSRILTMIYSQIRTSIQSYLPKNVKRSLLGDQSAGFINSIARTINNS